MFPSILRCSFTKRQTQMEEPCNMSPKSKNPFERNEGERNMFRHSNLIEGTLEMHFLSSPPGYFCRISSVLRCTHFLQMDAPSRCQRLPHASPSSGNSSRFCRFDRKVNPHLHNDRHLQSSDLSEWEQGSFLCWYQGGIWRRRHWTYRVMMVMTAEEVIMMVKMMMLTIVLITRMVLTQKLNITVRLDAKLKKKPLLWSTV